MAKKGVKQALRKSARLKCVDKYYKMNISQLEQEIDKKKECTMVELKKLITLKYLKEEAKKKKITKFSTINKFKLFAALEDNLNDKKEWFSYLTPRLEYRIFGV